MGCSESSGIKRGNVSMAHFLFGGAVGGFSYHHVAFLLVVLNKNVIVFSLSLPTFGFTLQCIMPST